MKRILFSMIVAASVLTSCDPVRDSQDFSPNDYTAEQIGNSVTLKVYKDKECTQEAGPGEGNWVKFTTTPSTIVAVYNIKSGEENVLATGTDGVFNLAPRRGSSNDQTLYIRTYNSDGKEIVAEKSVNVWVQTELPQEILYLCSDDEEKDRAKIEKLLREGAIVSSEEYYLLYRRDVYLLADKSDLMQLIRFLIYDKGFEPDDFSLNFVEYLSYDDGGVLLYTFKSVNKELYVSIGEDGVDSFGYLAWDKESSCMELFSIDNARAALERGFPEGFDYDNDEVISWAKSRDDCPDVIDQIDYNKLKKMYEETND